MLFDDVLLKLDAARGSSLPGPPAQSSLAPRPRRFWVPGQIPDRARPAAGLALLYPADGDTRILLTVRGSHLAHHRGQVSLPGGAVEPGESIEQACLREAEEEVGIERSSVTIRLALTPLHIPVSGYVLHALVGTTPAPPTVRRAAEEVDRIVEVGLSRLSRSSEWTLETRQREGGSVDVPYFDIEGARLWGATAMVVGELLAALGAPVDPWSR